jgi:hypothetical protein
MELTSVSFTFLWLKISADTQPELGSELIIIKGYFWRPNSGRTFKVSISESQQLGGGGIETIFHCKF